MTTIDAAREELNEWLFDKYFNTWVGIAAGRIAQPEQILDYWSVPLHASGPVYTNWLHSPDEVVGLLNQSHEVLKREGFTHTDVIDRKLTVYNQNAGRADAIWSRCRGNGTEIERVAVSFEIRRRDDDWTIVSVTSLPTASDKLTDFW